jgi:PAS domain S-box-containing protein
MSQRAPGPGWSPTASERRFQAVTESINDAVIVTDPRSAIMFWNAGAASIFGYSAEEALGQPLTMLMPERFREAHLRGMARVLGGGKPHVIGRTVRLAGLHKDGHEFPIELTLGRWADEDSQLFTGIVHDVSERERSERYLAAQLAMTGTLVEAETADDAVPRLLPALGSTMGWQIAVLWTRGEDDLLRCEEFWHDAEVAAKQFEARTRAMEFRRGEGLPGLAWAEGKPVCILDYSRDERFPRAPLAAACGLHRAIAVPLEFGGDLRAVMEFLTYETGEPDAGLTDMMETLSRQLGLFFVRRGTERALAQARSELEQRAAELERSNADLEQFAYVASHDLSEPLRTVTGFIQLLAQRYEGKLGDDADEFIAYALSGVARMRQLIDDLLVFSRVGSAELRRAPVRLADVVARVRDNLSGGLEESRGRIVAGELPTVQGDATQLEQLMQNLVSNALKFHGDEPPVVELSAERLDGTWRVTVQDNGIGIDPQHAERIFKMFQRLHDRDSYGGTGIGLAVCKRIVERHGGEISVEPNPDGGSRFAFTILDASPATEDGR